VAAGARDSPDMVSRGSKWSGAECQSVSCPTGVLDSLNPQERHRSTRPRRDDPQPQVSRWVTERSLFAV
jgi:hypothetical protein